MKKQLFTIIGIVIALTVFTASVDFPHIFHHMYDDADHEHEEDCGETACCVVFNNFVSTAPIMTTNISINDKFIILNPSNKITRYSEIIKNLDRPPRA